MTGKEKFVRKIVANCVIVAVIVAVFSVSFAYIRRDVSAADAPIYKGGAADKVSLMVNVYWGTEYIQPMLDIFAENNVTTTFFVGGMWVKDNEETLKKIYAAGHEIANHGFFHKDQKKLDYARNREEIEVTHKLVESILGIKMDLFAPPSGSFGDTTIRAAEDLGYRTIMWSLDTIDWRDKDSELIFSRATKKAEGGSLILMHPTEATVNALNRIIKTLANKQLTVARVSEVLAG